MQFKSIILIISLSMATFAYAQDAIDNTTNTETPTPATGTAAVDTSTARNPNQINKVTPSPNEDEIITNSIMSHIKTSPALSNQNVTVQTNQGIVTVSGEVDSDTQASALIELAESIVGVINVNTDHLKVKGSQQLMTDLVIAAKVKGLLIREHIFGSQDVDSLNIGVEVKNGVVYLSGQVTDKKQIQNAINLIRGMDGVNKVIFSIKTFTPIPNNNTPQNPNP